MTPLRKLNRRQLQVLWDRLAEKKNEASLFGAARARQRRLIVRVGNELARRCGL